MTVLFMCALRLNREAFIKATTLNVRHVTFNYVTELYSLICSGAFSEHSVK